MQVRGAAVLGLIMCLGLACRSKVGDLVVKAETGWLKRRSLHLDKVLWNRCYRVARRMQLLSTATSTGRIYLADLCLQVSMQKKSCGLPQPYSKPRCMGMGFTKASCCGHIDPQSLHDSGISNR